MGLCSCIHENWNLFVATWFVIAIMYVVFLQRSYIEALACLLPWHWFEVADMCLMATYYILAACVQYSSIDEAGDTSKLGQVVHALRLWCCLPTTILGVLLGGGFLAADWACLTQKAKLEPLMFGYGALIYLILRCMFSCCASCVMCMQWSALKSSSKTPVDKQLGAIPVELQAFAAAESVQSAASVLGVPQIAWGILVGEKAASMPIQAHRPRVIRTFGDDESEQQDLEAGQTSPDRDVAHIERVGPDPSWRSRHAQPQQEGADYSRRHKRHKRQVAEIHKVYPIKMLYKPPEASLEFKAVYDDIPQEIVKQVEDRQRFAKAKAAAAAAAEAESGGPPGVTMPPAVQTV